MCGCGSTFIEAKGRLGRGWMGWGWWCGGVTREGVVVGTPFEMRTIGMINSK